MTKRQLLIQKEELMKQIKEIDKRIAEIGDTLFLSDKAKPFHEWNLSEMNDLCEINETAFDWFMNDANHNKTIADYNYTVIKAKDKVIARNYKDMEGMNIL